MNGSCRLASLYKPRLQR